MAEIRFQCPVCASHLRMGAEITEVTTETETKERDGLAEEKENVDSFDLATLPAFPCVAILGKRASGKSELIKDLVKRLPFDEIHVFDGLQQNPPPASKFTAVFKEVTIRQQNKATSGERGRVVFVFDNCCQEKSLLTSPELSDLFMNGRHLGIAVIFAKQYWGALPPVLRTNLDAVFIFRQYNAESLSKIYRTFNSMRDEKEFKHYFAVATENYGAYVYQMNTNPPRHSQYRVVTNDVEFKK